ncbi:hypothetical protein PHSC3_001406 [Chlamydiales bacterium STE3]|nr:hypothetical protein PHSC3_001406 [Chlamydiales bacterium STE3]
MIAIFLDIETTGLDYQIHQPIDIAFKIIDLSTGEEKFAYQSVIKVSEEDWELRDFASMEINGYSWEEVEAGKDADVVSSEIMSNLQELKIERGKAVFICQNPGFDKCFFSKLINVYQQERMQWPYHWLDFASMYWAHLTRELTEKKQGFPEALSLSKNAIAVRQQLLEEQLPHKAANGVDHLILCYKAIVGFPVEEKSLIS